MNRKARKEHRCSWCGEAVEPGTEYVRLPVFGEGTVQTWKAHPECNEAEQNMPDEAREAWADGEMYVYGHMVRGGWRRECNGGRVWDELMRMTGG